MPAHPRDEYDATPPTQRGARGEVHGEPTRRHVLRGAALGALAVPVVAACGGGGRSSGDAGSGGKPSGPVEVPVGDVPVDGGTVLGDAEVVVTQPSKGEFKAFSAVCTHQGCLVNEVADGKIVCPCHGSTFSIADGSVLGGPAPKPLPEANVTVKGGKVVVAPT